LHEPFDRPPAERLGPARRDSVPRQRRTMTLSTRTTLIAIAGVSLAAVGTALVTQHVFDMQPCPWCVLQRLMFVTIALVALGGLALRTAIGQRGVVFGVLLLAIAGVATALWHYFVATTSTSCNLSLADRIMSASGMATLLPDVFEARASCADGAVDLLGVPYPLWSLAVFVAIVATAAWLLLTLSAARR
jgi:disulfide bond formation protein DsbB